MRFIHHDLGNLHGGVIVEVTLKGSAANVRLLDSSNFNNYKAGRRHRFYGSHAKKSPVRLQIPHAGHWHVAVDFGGYAGQVRSSAQVLPGQLKPIREQPLASVPSLVNRDRIATPLNSNDVIYDVFISHASEDKDTVVRPPRERAEVGRVAGLVRRGRAQHRRQPASEDRPWIGLKPVRCCCTFQGLLRQRVDEL